MVFPVGSLAELLTIGVFVLLCVWAVFWLIRLAVRSGVSDALRMNRKWLESTKERDRESP
ncbi:hypothetical protein [Nocardioides terrisoli]|uniref:hypothetical protein n=1 Tax=Nocardioides terrisoli TaxID=3388267 RepID=UPI00287B5E58|nr:hypothetical protein [Nocardioides marmorisolisilvae]